MISPYIVGGSAVGLGSYTGYQAYRRDPLPEEREGDRMGRAAVWGARAGILGLGTYAMARNPQTWAAMSRMGRSAMSMGKQYSNNLSADISNNFSKSSGLGAGEAFAKSIGRRRLVMGGVGAMVGGMIGSNFDETGTGAVVGGVAGVVAAQAMRTGTRTIIPGRNPVSKFLNSKIKGGAGLLLTGAGLFLAGRAMAKPQYAEEAEAMPNVDGTYSYGDQGSGRRLRMMNASGDIALGLHNKRHG